jgi:hypothetical protein
MATNPHTGASLRTKPATQAYMDNYDAIFGKKNIKQVSENNQEDSQKCKTTKKKTKAE